MCEYEVNPLTNDKVITEIQNFKRKMIKLLKNNIKCQGHLKVMVIMLHVCEKRLDLSNNVCENEVNRLTNEKVIRENQNLNAICSLTALNRLPTVVRGHFRRKTCTVSITYVQRGT